MAASALTSVVLVLARTFDPPRGFLAESGLPDSVLPLYDRATADPRWASAAGAAERAYLLLRVLAADASLRATPEEDEREGRLGLGANEDEEFERDLARLGDLIERAAGVGAEPPEPEPPPVRGWPDEPEPPAPGSDGPTRGWPGEMGGDGLLGGNCGPTRGWPGGADDAGDGLLGDDAAGRRGRSAPRAVRPSTGGPVLYRDIALGASDPRNSVHPRPGPTTTPSGPRRRASGEALASGMTHNHGSELDTPFT